MSTQITSRWRRAATLVVVALMATSFWVSPHTTPAEAAESEAAPNEVVVEGSGWGHGLGLSQYGAWGMATTGSSYKQILGHYFSGSSVGTLGKGGRSAAEPIWVNLEQNFSSLELRVDAISGGGEPVTITRSGKAWFAKPGSTIRISGGSTCALTITKPGGKTTKVKDGPCKFDFAWYDWKGGSSPATAVAVTGCSEVDWNVSPPVTRQCRYARGMLHLRSGSGGMDLSAEMNMEDYVLGIAEMPYYWGDGAGMEALKAQAVAARSYARELQIYRGSPATNSCDAWCHVRDSTWDQRYVGYGHGGANWSKAVSATAGIVVTHPSAPNQGIVRAYYSSSTGGRTESIQEVRDGWDARPYYQSVSDHWAVDGTIPNSNASWKQTFDASRLAGLAGLDVVTAATVSSRTTGGSAAVVTLTGTKAGATRTATLAGATVRAGLGLKSAYFEISLTGGSGDAPPGTPPGGSGKCVNVEPGDGWQDVTLRLGLPWDQYPQVRAANPKAANSAGYLVIGAKVCAPGGSGGDTPPDTPAGGDDEPTTSAKCTKVRSGEGWVQVTLRLGLPSSSYPAVRSANAAATNAGGYLVLGAKVCTPGGSKPPAGGEPPNPPTAAECVNVKAGEGWIAVTTRLGLSSSQYPAVRAANPDAVNPAGYLILGRRVCAPGGTGGETPPSKPPGDTCIVVAPGEGWVQVTLRLGLPASAYSEVRSANPGASNAGGYLMAGAKVCST